MIIGYNTNGFANHRIEDCLPILAEIGYAAVAITLEPALLHPPNSCGVANCVETLKPILALTGLVPTIETGSRFILDPRRKHQPTLISSAAVERRRRIDFLHAAIDVAAELNAATVSLWSGAADHPDGEVDHWARLIEGLRAALEHASASSVRLAFEPEPGMFIDTMSKFERLHRDLNHPLFGLTLDIGHAYCLGDGDAVEHIDRWKQLLWNVHIEDMRIGVHEHLPFGEGEMKFPPIFAALHRAGYPGPVNVELSRHSHDAVETARRAFTFLQRSV
jgi:sugar phosphate isomerase/epimerase